MKLQSSFETHLINDILFNIFLVHLIYLLVYMYLIEVLCYSHVADRRLDGTFAHKYLIACVCMLCLGRLDLIIIPNVVIIILHETDGWVANTYACMVLELLRGALTPRGELRFPL